MARARKNPRSSPGGAHNPAWRVILKKELIKAAKRHGIYDRVHRRLKELQEMLDSEPERALEILTRQPTIFAVGEYEAKRIRVGNYRLFYYVDREKHQIIFFEIRHRRRAYKKRR